MGCPSRRAGRLRTRLRLEPDADVEHEAVAVVFGRLVRRTRRVADEVNYFIPFGFGREATLC
jgi:hypothetical protein